MRSRLVAAFVGACCLVALSSAAQAEDPGFSLANRLMTGTWTDPATYPVLVTRPQLTTRLNALLLGIARVRIDPAVQTAEWEQRLIAERQAAGRTSWLPTATYDREARKIPVEIAASLDRLAPGVKHWRIESATAAIQWNRRLSLLWPDDFPVDLPEEGRQAVINATVALVLNSLGASQRPIAIGIRPGDAQWPLVIALVRRAVLRYAAAIGSGLSSGGEDDQVISRTMRRFTDDLAYLHLGANADPLLLDVPPTDTARRQDLEDRLVRALLSAHDGWRSSTAPRPPLPPAAARAMVGKIDLLSALRAVSRDATASTVPEFEHVPGARRMAIQAAAWIATWKSTPATQPITAINGRGRFVADRLLYSADPPWIYPAPAVGWSDAEEIAALLPPMSAAPATATAALVGSLTLRHRHPWIPWVAAAGSDEGTDSFRDPAARPGAVRIAARAYGAIPDDELEDGAAISAALHAAGAAGGGVVELEPGRYVLDQPVRLSHDDVALVGAGSSRTRLFLRRSLTQALGPEGASDYAFMGGMIWCSPLDRLPQGGWLERQPVRDLWVATAVRQGAAQLTLTGPDVERLSEVAPGSLVRLDIRASATMCRLIGADPAFDDYPWRLWTRSLRMKYYARVSHVDGTTLHVTQGLRLPVLTCSPVQVVLHPLAQQRIAVRGLAVVAATRAEAGHLREPGYNGITAIGVVGAEFTDFVGENLDNVLVLDRAQHVTARRITSSGAVRAHHFVTMRDNSHDNMIEDFRIAQRTWHGISVQDTSSGNVFRRGRMHAGTFDSHRSLPFDTVRTDIVVSNTGVPGGEATAGPYAGRRMVHWNVRITGGRDPQRVERWSEWINVPALHPFGALVGVRGAPELRLPPPRRPWEGRDLPLMPPGISTALTLDAGADPSEPDLYLAQRRSLKVGP